MDENALQQARAVGFLVARGNSSGRWAAARWWRECEAARRPYVRVTPRRTCASVELDMMPTGRQLSGDAHEAVAGAVSRFWSQLPKARRTWYGAGNVTYVPALPLEAAEALAAELAAIGRKGRSVTDNE